VDVEVIPLNLYLLSKSGKMFVRSGDDHIREIATRLKSFDFVNIQFEAGLYGCRIPDILRRVKWLIDAAPNVTVTMHRVDPLRSSSRELFNSYWRELPDVLKATQSLAREVRLNAYAGLYYAIIQHCDHTAKNSSKNVWICVHTKRERRLVQDVYKFQNCFDYPITFLTAAERREALAHSDRTRLLKTCGVPAGGKIVGVFGYISGYKGVEAVIQSVARLPKDYYLCFIGSQHPQSIREYLQIDPYLGSVIDFIQTTEKEILEEKLERIKLARKADPQMKIALPSSFGVAPAENDVVKGLVEDDLVERIRFVGNLPDPEFIEALRLSDAVVLPYLEVGQSMSGVIALATEAGARMFCSNNLSFAEVKKYYGEVFHSFDIGNYIELAQKILKGGDDFVEQRTKLFEKYNIEKNISLQLEKFGFDNTNTPARDAERLERELARAEYRDDAVMAPAAAD
jgi:glycosyltransferase involved in cell wall biosynthesis